MAIAVYAGTFDPLSFGHLSIVRGAARIFAHVRVLVAVNPGKQPLFGLHERVQMINEVVHRMPQVSVDSTEQLVVEYAREMGAGFLIRGLRTSMDADYEINLAKENREHAPEITTIFLPAEPAYADTSSTQIREIAGRGEPIAQFCPASVAKRVVQRVRETAGAETDQ
jgi:pantetheine-phosphate adenylyltransferase